MFDFLTFNDSYTITLLYNRGQRHCLNLTASSALYTQWYKLKLWSANMCKDFSAVKLDTSAKLYKLHVFIKYI